MTTTTASTALAIPLDAIANLHSNESKLKLSGVPSTRASKVSFNGLCRSIPLTSHGNLGGAFFNDVVKNGAIPHSP